MNTRIVKRRDNYPSSSSFRDRERDYDRDRDISTTSYRNDLYGSSSSSSHYYNGNSSYSYGDYGRDQNSYRSPARSRSSSASSNLAVTTSSKSKKQKEKSKKSKKHDRETSVPKKKSSEKTKDLSKSSSKKSSKDKSKSSNDKDKSSKSSSSKKSSKKSSKSKTHEAVTSSRSRSPLSRSRSRTGSRSYRSRSRSNVNSRSGRTRTRTRTRSPTHSVGSGERYLDRSRDSTPPSDGPYPGSNRFAPGKVRGAWPKDARAGFKGSKYGPPEASGRNLMSGRGAYNEANGSMGDYENGWPGYSGSKMPPQRYSNGGRYNSFGPDYMPGTAHPASNRNQFYPPQSHLPYGGKGSGYKAGGLYPPAPPGSKLSKFYAQQQINVDMPYKGEPGSYGHPGGYHHDGGYMGHHQSNRFMPNNRYLNHYQQQTGVPVARFMGGGPTRFSKPAGQFVKHRVENGDEIENGETKEEDATTEGGEVDDEDTEEMVKLNEQVEAITKAIADASTAGKEMSLTNEQQAILLKHQTLHDKIQQKQASKFALTGVTSGPATTAALAAAAEAAAAAKKTTKLSSTRTQHI